MDKFVITIGRQLGAGGRAVGELLARRLGVRMYDRQLLTLAAEESGLCPEFFEQADEKHSHGLLSTLVGYLRAPFAGATDTLHDVLSDDALFQIQSDVIRHIAERESAIFLGRCADYILRDHPRRLSLFLTAERADRIARLQRVDGNDEAQAEARMSSIDNRRGSYYTYYSGRRWGEAANYDLCINSSDLGEEQTAEFVLAFAERKFRMKF